MSQESIDTGIRSVTRGTYTLSVRSDSTFAEGAWEAGLRKLGFSDLKIETSDQEMLALAKYEREEPCLLRSTDLLRWGRFHRWEMDPYRMPDASKPSAFELSERGLYELTFVARRYAVPKLEDLERGLREMGWDTLRILRTHRDIRFPGAATVALDAACAVAVWTRGNSVTTVADPFLFQEVRRLDGSATEPADPSANET